MRKSIRKINLKYYCLPYHIEDKSIEWIVMFYTPNCMYFLRNSENLKNGISKSIYTLD